MNERTAYWTPVLHTIAVYVAVGGAMAVLFLAGPAIVGYAGKSFLDNPLPWIVATLLALRIPAEWRLYRRAKRGLPRHPLHRS